MNLRAHSGHDKLGMASCALLISIRRFTIGKPTMNSPTETLTYALAHADVAVPTSLAEPSVFSGLAALQVALPG